MRRNIPFLNFFTLNEYEIMFPRKRFEFIARLSVEAYLHRTAIWLNSLHTYITSVSAEVHHFRLGCLSDDHLVNKWCLFPSYSDHFRMQLGLMWIVHVFKGTFTCSVVSPRRVHTGRAGPWVNYWVELITRLSSASVSSFRSQLSAASCP